MPNPHLPAELLDHIVDFLHDRGDALKSCCLVSKSWIPHTRNHLFADVKFCSPDCLESWKETFPDPLVSPAHYTKALLVNISYPRIATAADAELGGWTSGFSSVMHLEVVVRVLNGGVFYDKSAISFVPFHGFSPVLKSLCVTFFIIPSSQVFDLIISFPLLEDLTVIANYGTWAGDNNDSDWPSTVAQPSNEPMFTGSLELHIGPRGITPIVRRLLSLPGGLHFQKLTLRWYHEEDLSSTMMLVEECSSTLESLDIACTYCYEVMPVCIDLSKAKKLRDVVFRPGLWNVEWIPMTLQTITPTHQDLRQISIYIPYKLCDSMFSSMPPSIAEIRELWLNLDCLLVQLWELHLIRLRVASEMLKGDEWNMWMRDNADSFLPEITRRGIIDLSE